jgi:hypothetical protein
MFKFDQLIRSSSTVREVKIKFPETAAVFDALGFRSACDDCAIEVVAKRQGLSSAAVVQALNGAAFGNPEGTE